MPGVDGMRKQAAMQPRQARSRMWQSMRVLRTFTVGDLQAAGEVTAAHARKYVRGLLRHGYLRISRPHQSGVTGGHAVYALVRDTGPYAPRLSKDGLHDPNLHTADREREQPTVRIPRSEYERALACVRACAGMADPEAEVAALRARAAGSSVARSIAEMGAALRASAGGGQ